MADSTTLLKVLQTPITPVQTPERENHHFLEEDFLDTDFLHRRRTSKISNTPTDIALGLEAITFIPGGYHEHQVQPKNIDGALNIATYTNEELVQPVSAAFRHLRSAWSTSIYPKKKPRSGQLFFEYRSGSTDEAAVMAILLKYASYHVVKGNWDDPKTASKKTRAMLKEAHRQACKYDCPQVLIFDGLTLLRFDFCNVGMSIATTKHIQYDMVFDHPYLMFTPNVPPVIVSVQDADRISYSGYGRSTIREVLYDTVLTGLRRVICCRLSPPMPISYEGAQYNSAWFDWTANPALLQDGHLVPPSPECEVQLCVVPDTPPVDDSSSDRRDFGFQWVFVVPGGQSYPVSIIF